MPCVPSPLCSLRCFRDHAALCATSCRRPTAALLRFAWRAGEGWGEDGFFRLSRSSASPEGACGIYKAASFPTKEGDSNPEVPEICGVFGFTECPLRSTCACDFSLFGFFCLSWACQAGAQPQSPARAA